MNKLKTISLLLLLLLLIFCADCGIKKINPYEVMQDNKFSLPSILELESETKKLLYFGTYHSNNINDELFKTIQVRFKSFKPDFVLHEGDSNWPIFKDIDSTVMVSGEPGYIIQLSQNSGLPYSSIEPSQIEEYQSLKTQYYKKDILLMYICRQIDQQQRIDKSHILTDDDFEMNMEGFLGYLYEIGFDLNENELEFNYWKKVYFNFFEKELKWRTFDTSNYYPNFFKNKLNEINRSSDKFRNEYMVEKIITSLKVYERVMVLVGGGHLFIQKDGLNKKFNQNFN